MIDIKASLFLTVVGLEFTINKKYSLVNIPNRKILLHQEMQNERSFDP